jgi:hypothetical protein
MMSPESADSLFAMGVSRKNTKSEAVSPLSPLGQLAVDLDAPFFFHGPWGE